jgi:PKD repeat protein
LLAALGLAWLAAVIANPTTPPSGTITEANPSLAYTGGPLFVTQGASTCPNGANQSDRFDLTTTLPSSFGTKQYTLHFELVPPESGDMVLDLKNSNDVRIQAADNGFLGETEALDIAANPNTTVYHVYTCLFAGSAASYPVTIKLNITEGGGGGGAGPCDATIFGTADPTCAGNPRYQIFVPNGPDAGSADNFQGEYNIGFNPKTGRIMNLHIGPTLRITPAEIKPDGTNTSSGMPESCPELWQDKSAPSTDTPAALDPILWTDQKSGRTLASNATGGANANYAYTDDDGELWVPIGAAPPNFGADHQTIGTGPFPATLSALTTPENQGQYVLYCSQNLVGAACQRSLTLGTSYENGQIATGPGALNSQGCGGLHGHVRIAPDGTAWLPDKSCGAKQGGAISLDTSTTPWTEFAVEKKTADANGPAFTTTPQSPGGDDPSIAIDAANTVYYCYVNSEAGGQEGHVHVAVGKRNGTTVTWLRDADVGKSHGVVNAAHTEAIGGSAGRAACGFLGTDKDGNYQAGTYVGMNWYVFMATTYDEGRTWTTVNATPNDPVQHNTGIWQQGGGGQNGNRNLLDFNEITLDDKGRPLYGYSDGCVSSGCVSGSQANNDGGARMRVARQIGAKSLLPQFDNVNDTNDGIGDAGPINPKTVSPKRPCLLDKDLGHPTPSTRDSSSAKLRWKAPDNGGAPIVNYDVYRGTTPGGPYSLIGSTPDAKPQYEDTTSGDTIPDLYYVIKANSAAPLMSAFSNEVHLVIGVPTGTETICTFPGLTLLTDSIGTGGTAPAGSAGPGMDLRSFQLTQPFASDGVIKLIVTINTDPGVSPQPAESSWYVSMRIASGAGVRYKAVRMFWGGPTPTFESYTPGVSGAGTTDGRFVVAGTQRPAEPGSSYVTPFNKVIIIVKASDLGLAPGDVINGFVSAVTVTTGGVITGTVDEMPGGLAYTGSFAVPSNQFCRPNQPPVVDSFVGTPEGGQSPLTVTFNGSAHDPDTSPAPADTVANYHIDFGDGQSVDLTSPPVNLTHEYSTSAEHQDFVATLTVTDSRGLESITNGVARIEVINEVVPELSASPSSPVLKGETVTLDASASHVPAGRTIVSYTFDPGDGNPPLVTASSSITKAYALGGLYTAAVNIEDSTGATSATPATAEIEVINSAPVADLSADPASGPAPLNVTFDASGSSDPDSVRTTDQVMRYDFLDFGDGSPPETRIVPTTTHTYSRPGLYNVLLRVYDEEDRASSSDALVQVEVPNTPPAAQLTVTPKTIGKNRAVAFDASGSSDAEGPVTYRYDFGDGSPLTVGSASKVSHAYARAGSYTASVTVFDVDGAASSASDTLTVTNSPPLAVLTATSAKIQPAQATNLSGASSRDPDAGDGITSYTFGFGDGSPAVTQTGASVLHTYMHPGDYQATLTVTDRDGVASDRAVLDIKVSAGDNTEVLTTGGLPPWSLLILGLLGFTRRIRARAAI